MKYFLTVVQGTIQLCIYPLNFVTEAFCFAADAELLTSCTWLWLLVSLPVNCTATESHKLWDMDDLCYDLYVLWLLFASTTDIISVILPVQPAALLNARYC